MVQIDNMSMSVSAGGFAFHHPSGNSNHGRMRWHTGNNNRSRPYSTVMTDRHRSEHGGAGAYDHPIFHRGVALFFSQTGAAECDALINSHIIVDLRRLADHHAHAVVDKKTPADLSSRMDFNASKEAAEITGEPSQAFEAV